MARAHSGIRNMRSLVLGCTTILVIVVTILGLISRSTHHTPGREPSVKTRKGMETVTLSIFDDIR
jgi:hypothetical protein